MFRAICVSRLAVVLCSVVLCLFAGPVTAKAGAGNTARLEYPLARVAVVSAFQPEIDALLKHVAHAKTHRINGVDFTLGELEGRRVVLFLSGISMTNAAMNMQLALDHFNLTHIVVSGIAGGVNPQLDIGDVTVAERWGQYLEVLMARESGSGQYTLPDGLGSFPFPNNGPIFPRPLQVRSADQPQWHEQFWFKTDPSLMAVAQRIADVTLDACTVKQVCLSHEPRLVVGGNGVSGSAFVDNADWRRYLFKTFQANVVDMETAAIAMVAYSNGVPFIAFRSLSDLAGGGKGENEMNTFFSIAARNSAHVLVAFFKAWEKQ
jgi:adenosylhomocysteine nucleosidase